MNVASQILDQKAAIPQEPTPEAPKEASAPAQLAEPKEEKLSPRLETLIKREQAALQAETRAKKERAELEERLAKYQDFESAKENPLKALELLGLNYDQLTQTLLKNGEIPPEVQIKRIEEKFDSFKSAQEQAEARRNQEARTQAEEQEKKAVSNFKTEILTYLDDNKTRYELVAFENQQELVFDVIDEHYNRTLDAETGIGKVMSISEAADKVEEFLEQKYNKSRELNKVKALWSSVPKGVLKQAVKPETKPSQKPATLTNQLSAHPTQRKTPVTDEERIQRAIAYAKGLRP